MKDLLGRTVDYFRVSVTDRCNLRCVYCMPAKGAAFLPPEALLSLDEILRAVSCAARLGIRAVRLTGGEPMARPGCLSLVRRLKQAEGIRRVAMTSNGLLLRGRMAEAAAAGRTVRITVNRPQAVLRMIPEAGDAGRIELENANEGEAD